MGIMIDYGKLVAWTLLPQQQVRRIIKNGATYIWRDGIINALFAAEKLAAENYPDLINYLDRHRATHSLGAEFEFVPPVVLPDQRGYYYLVVEMPTLDAIFTAVNEIDLKRLQRNRDNEPVAYIYQSGIYSSAISHIYPDTDITTLGEAALRYISDQTVKAMEARGWEFAERNAIFTKPLVIDREAHKNMDHHLAGEKWTVKSLLHYVALDAYDTNYYLPEQYYPQEFREYAEEMAEKYGYERKGDNYDPKPIELPDDIEQFGVELLSAEGLLKTSKFGHQCIPVATIRAALVNDGITISDEQIKDQLLGSQGKWRKPLILNGFKTSADVLSEQDYPNYDPQFYRFDGIVKQRRLGDGDTDRKITIAHGFPVMLAGISIDAATGDLVYLDMVGSQNAIKANWAALMQFNRYFQYSRIRYKVGTSQCHTVYQQPLPSGLYQMVIVHNMSLPKNLDHTVDVGYIIAKQGDDMPEHFAATMDKLLEIPILPEWSEYLWITGRATGLIDYTCSPNKQVGITAWKIRGLDNWKELISTAIKAKEISI